MAEFLTIGEPLVVFASENTDASLTDATDFKKYLAGAELNVAIGVSRLEHSSEYISAVGDDPFGAFIKKTIAENKVGTSYLAGDDKNWTGFYLKQKISKGDPATYYFRRGSAAAHFNEETLNSIDFSQVKIAHLSSIFAALSASNLDAELKLFDLLHEHGVQITYDPNLRPTIWDSQERMISVANDLAKRANIVLPGINEGEVLMGSRDPEKIADFYLNQGSTTETVVVKLGPAGAFIKQKDGTKFEVPGFKVDNVVDTVGAGDGFALGLITGLLENLPIQKAATRGCAVGALAVMNPSDNGGYPTVKELEDFYKDNKE